MPTVESYAVVCDACEGRGFIQEAHDAYLLCTKCEGDGRLLVNPDVLHEVTGKDLLIFMAKVLVGAAGVGLFVYWYFRIPLP